LTTSVRGGSRERRARRTSRAGAKAYSKYVESPARRSATQLSFSWERPNTKGARAGQGRRCTLSTSSSLHGEAQHSRRPPGSALIQKAHEREIRECTLSTRLKVRCAEQRRIFFTILAAPGRREQGLRGGAGTRCTDSTL
jgi:hypothetical protein